MGTSDMTIELLKSRLHYNPETGLFTRISKCSTMKVGKLDKDGYLTIKVNGDNYQAHRLAFMYMTGRFPSITDHINRIRTDNRWCNLREVNFEESMRNRSIGILSDHTRTRARSGHRGVYWDGRKDRWFIQVRHKGKVYGAGYHVDVEDAARAARSLRAKIIAEHSQATR